MEAGRQRFNISKLKDHLNNFLKSHFKGLFLKGIKDKCGNINVSKENVPPLI